MAVTANWYGKGLLHMAKGDILWKASGGSTIKVLLTTSTYTPNQDTDETLSNITNEVANGNGYTTGGFQLTLSDPTYDAATNEMRLTASANPSWANSTITARYAVIYLSSGVAGTSYLLGYINFGQDESSVSGTFTITIAATGLLKITAA